MTQSTAANPRREAAATTSAQAPARTLATRFPRTPLLAGTDVEAKRAELLAYFHTTFDRYESLFEVLACEEAYFRKPISLRHPCLLYTSPSPRD